MFTNIGFNWIGQLNDIVTIGGSIAGICLKKESNGSERKHEHVKCTKKK